MSKIQESRYWHYRTNDISDEHLDKLKNVPCEWSYIGNVETGELEKGLHRHAAFKFNRSHRDSKIMKDVCARSETYANRDKTWYLEPKHTNSSIISFVSYVFKNDLKNLVHGDVSIIGLRSEILQEQIQDMDPDSPKKLTKEEIEENKKNLQKLRLTHASVGDIDWFRENDPKYMTGADFSRLLVWAQPDANKKLDKIENYFIYGDSGTGKSSSVDYLFPCCYRKIKNNEKWDSYYNLREGHEVVYFDEMDSTDEFEMCMGGFVGIKEKTDIYPFPVRQNYGNRSLMIRPKMFIITSNFTPSQIFASENKYGRKPQHLEMMLRTFNRRFKVMHVSEWHAMHNIRFDQELQRIVPIVPFIEECQTDHSQDSYDSEEELPSTSLLVPIEKKRRPAKPTKKVIV